MMNPQHLLSQPRAWTRHSPNLLIKIGRGCALGVLFIPAFGGWMLAILLLSKSRRRDSQGNEDHASGSSNRTTRQIEPPFLRRLLNSWTSDLKEPCRPNSFSVPLLTSTLALPYAVRAMQDSHLSLSGTDEYQTSCPAYSRRTVTAVFVKLFAATVTTLKFTAI